MDLILSLRNTDYSREYTFIAGLILGLLCTINGFMFNIGGFNIRICDIPFFILPLFWCIFKYNHHFYFNNNIRNGIFIIALMFFWFTISGFINFESFNELYQENFIKYYINKTLWIPIYVGMYMMFGGKSFVYGILYGISICALFNVLMLLYEYNSIRNGVLPRYEFLDYLGVIIDEKKSKVINQDMIRPTGLMLDPNYTGGYTGIGVIFFDYLYSIKRKKKFIFCSVLCLIPMFLVFSRTGLFSIILTFLLSLFLHYGRSRKHYPVLSPWVILLMVIGSVVALSYFLSISDAAYSMLLDRLTMNDSSAGVRTKYIDFFFKLASPIQVMFGVGAAGFFLNDFWGYSVVWAPESSFITLFVEQGLLFIVFFINVLLYIFKKLLKKNYYWALILVYINLIGLSYNFLGDRVYFFLLVCLILYSFSPAPRRLQISESF